MTKNVGIIGSGNWGSCIAKICGKNVQKSGKFNSEVRMWVYEELVDGRKLSEIINEQHENVKYLAGTKLPENVVANPELAEVGSWADILVFVLPPQFVSRACDGLAGHVRPGAYAVSLTKGLNVKGAGMSLLSDIVRDTLGVDCAVLMGANLAPEVAKETYCEATIGCCDAGRAAELKLLFQTEYFRLVIVPDEIGVELSGSLKNIIATAAGFCDALGFGDNTKAAIIRLGFMEIMRFTQNFYAARGVTIWTLRQSCGMGDIISSCYNTKEVKWAGVEGSKQDSRMFDLVTTCYGGRNRKLAEALVKTGKPMQQLEAEMLNGQRLQGPLTAGVVFKMLEDRGQLQQYPLMVAVHRVCSGSMRPEQLIDAMRQHPEHL